MTDKDINRLRNFPTDRLTEVFVELFRRIDSVHEDDFQAYGHFGPENLEIDSHDVLHIRSTEFQRLNAATRRQNYHDFAAAIYMVCTGSETAENMARDASRITSPVLREVVETFGSDDKSEGELLYKLRHDYKGGATFFSDRRNAGQTSDEYHETEEDSDEDFYGQTSGGGEPYSRPENKKSSKSKILGSLVLLCALFGSTFAYHTCNAPRPSSGAMTSHALQPDTASTYTSIPDSSNLNTSRELPEFIVRYQTIRTKIPGTDIYKTYKLPIITPTRFPSLRVRKYSNFQRGDSLLGKLLIPPKIRTISSIRKYDDSLMQQFNEHIKSLSERSGKSVGSNAAMAAKSDSMATVPAAEAPVQSDSIR